MPATAIAQQIGQKQHIIFRGWEGMDTQQERVGLDPTKLSWLENLQPVAKNKLQCVPGPAPAIATIAGQTIFRQFYVEINGLDFQLCFTVGGAAYQVCLSSNGVTQFAPPGTFSDPDVTGYNSERALIADPTAGYCSWDGSILAQAGGVSPRIVVTNGGTGYLSPPTVVISGGSGSGATATSTILGGSVVGVQLTNPGTNYRAGDVLTVTFIGSGSGAAATAIPFPIFTFPVTTVAVAFQRVWLGGGRILQYLGTAGFDDANTANAAGSTTLKDADLAHKITALRSLNNFLYIFGDNSVKQIGAITVSGASTIFAITTLSSDTGTVFPLSIASYERLVTFCNFDGIWQIFGATIVKISDEMDGVFPLIDFTQSPQAVILNIRSIRCYLLAVRYLDPVRGARTIFLTRQRKKWFVVSQGNGILSVATAFISGKLLAYASSGSDVTQILASSTTAVSVLVSTALDAQNKEMLSKRAIRVGVTQFAVGAGTVNFSMDSENGSSATQYSFAFGVTWLNAAQQAVTWLNASSQLVTFVGSGFLWQETQAQQSGIYLGATLSGTFTGLRLNAIVIEYVDGTMMRSRNK